MIELRSDQLHFAFPQTHPRARCSIEFQRTLRLPDDGRTYPLPAGLGRFPLAHVDDYAQRVPKRWMQHGGVFLPMYQAEALWINFRSNGYPFAVKVASGKINAVSGEPWDDALLDSTESRGRQGYVVIPHQPWLDGFCVAKGEIRQFVAMPLGKGYSVEEQVTGTAEHGGIQLAVYPMIRAFYEDSVLSLSPFCVDYGDPLVADAWVSELGLAPGGRMAQDIYEDPYGRQAWDQSVRARCFVHLLNSEAYEAVTGLAPPTRPPTSADYSSAGLPWFEYYDERPSIGGSEPLAELTSLASMADNRGEEIPGGNKSVEHIKTIKLAGPDPADGGDL